MAIWERTLNISDLFLACEDGTLSPRETIEKIADRFEALRAYDDEYLEDRRECLIEDFRMIADDDNDFEDVDHVLEELYDFGDTHISGGHFDAVKACWIKTRF